MSVPATSMVARTIRKNVELRWCRAATPRPSRTSRSEAGLIQQGALPAADWGASERGRGWEACATADKLSNRLFSRGGRTTKLQRLYWLFASACAQGDSCYQRQGKSCSHNQLPHRTLWMRKPIHVEITSSSAAMPLCTEKATCKPIGDSGKLGWWGPP